MRSALFLVRCVGAIGEQRQQPARRGRQEPDPISAPLPSPRGSKLGRYRRWGSIPGPTRTPLPPFKQNDNYERGGCRTCRSITRPLTPPRCRHLLLPNPTLPAFETGGRRQWLEARVAWSEAANPYSGRAAVSWAFTTPLKSQTSPSSVSWVGAGQRIPDPARPASGGPFCPRELQTETSSEFIHGEHRGRDARPGLVSAFRPGPPSGSSGRMNNGKPLRPSCSAIHPSGGRATAR